jgi:hypothetical protein
MNNSQDSPLTFTQGEAFLLHVFWEAPSMAAAQKLLHEGLKKCAQATHRDTPCVTSYFFRISSNDVDLHSEGLKQQSVRVEFTEVYLDERAFWGHACSSDFLDCDELRSHPTTRLLCALVPRLKE